MKRWDTRSSGEVLTVVRGSRAKLNQEKSRKNCSVLHCAELSGRVNYRYSIVKHG